MCPLGYMSSSASAFREAEVRSCFCIGPQNGDPVCPCKMRSHTEREMGLRALEILAKIHKPRARVKAIGRLV